MNINQLKYFISVSKYQSFTKAASEHFISQTAITLQIKALEDELHAKLIDRSSRPLRLTSTGEVFLIEAKAIVDRIYNAKLKVAEVSAGIGGTLRIGYTKGYERSDLSDLIRTFTKLYPNVFITCHRHDSETLASKLINDDYDLVFTWDCNDLAEHQNIETINYEKVPLCVALYQSHPLALHDTLTRSDLIGERLLQMTPSKTGNSTGDYRFNELYKKAGYVPTFYYTTNDPESVLMMVAAELGVSILPTYITSKLEKADNLVFRPLVGADEFEQMICMYKKTSNNILLQKFLNHIKK